jgi:hypothetical protein
MKPRALLVLKFQWITAALVVVVGFGFILLSLVQATPVEAPVTAPAPDTSVQRFDQEFKASLEAQHQTQMAALEVQRTTLQRLEQSVQQLLAKATPPPAPVVEPTKAVVEPAKTVVAPLAEPIRRSSTIWNFNGTWDYSTEELIAHLLSEHSFAAAAYSREQLQTIHDNLHNGYTALGESVMQTTAPVYYSTTPRRGGLFRGSNCAGGNCP